MLKKSNLIERRKISGVAIIIVVIILVGAAYLIYKQVGQIYNPKSVLSVPNASSTQAERGRYMDFVAKNAVLGDTINISGCVPSPMTLSITKESELTIVNEDTVSHEIFFNPDNVFVIGTSSSKTIKAKLGKTVGAFPFTCDSSKSAVGVVLIR